MLGVRLLLKYTYIKVIELFEFFSVLSMKEDKYFSKREKSQMTKRISYKATIPNLCSSRKTCIDKRYLNIFGLTSC